MGSGTTLSYSVSGGAQPYSAVSADTRVVNGSISGSSLSISAFNAGSAVLQITDALGTVPNLQDVKLVTDLKGQVSQTLLAPSVSNVYLISASGSGVNAADYPLNVFSGVPDPVRIPDGATPSLSASPNVVSVNSAGSTANQATLRFLFLNKSNSPVERVRVRFVDMTTGLARIGATLSSDTSSTPLYTDSSGTVSVQYIPGQNSSPRNGVTVKACYSGNDFDSTACPNEVSVSLTTVGQALAVSVGDDNKLSVGTGGTYIKKFVITVADSAGRAVVNAPVAIAVDLTHYGKGSYGSSYLDSNGFPVNPTTVVPFDLEAAYPAFEKNPDGTIDIATVTDPSLAPQRIWCPNEDTNRNGNVDTLENINGSIDSNGQPTLDPRKADLIVSYADPAVTKTNADGVLVIKVEYSQRFGTWLAYRVIATTNVSGSQGLAERLFVTDILAEDAANGSFITPPYGVEPCVSPN